MRIPLKSGNKIDLVKRIRELEKRGYQCIAPIREIRSYKKVFNRHIDDKRVKKKYDHTDEYVYYVAVMEGERVG